MAVSFAACGCAVAYRLRQPPGSAYANIMIIRVCGAASRNDLSFFRIKSISLSRITLPERADVLLSCANIAAKAGCQYRCQFLHSDLSLWFCNFLITLQFVYLALQVYGLVPDPCRRNKVADLLPTPQRVL